MGQDDNISPSSKEKGLGKRVLLSLLIVIFLLIIAVAYLAYSAGYFGTVSGEKGIWKEVYEKRNTECENITGECVQEVRKWQNETMMTLEEKEEWEQKYWEANGTAESLISQNSKLSLQLNQTLLDKNQFKALYDNQTKETQSAKDENIRLIDNLTNALNERDQWYSNYNLCQQNFTSLSSAYNQKLQELASLTESRDEWKALYNDMKDSRDDWESQYLNTKSLYDNLTADFEELVEAHNKLSNDYTALSNQNSYLRSQNTALSSDLNRLWTDYSNLNSTYFIIKNLYDELNQTCRNYTEEYTALNSSYWQLMADYFGLNLSYADLHQTHISLLNDYNSLMSEYSDLQTDYADLQEEYDSLIEDYEWLEQFWSTYYQWFRLRSGNYEDVRNIITQNDPDISSKSSEILGTSADGDLDWADTDTLHTWVANNIEYSYDTAIVNPFSWNEEFDYYQSPNRTLEVKHGDCEDKTNLLLSLFLAEEDVLWAFGAQIVFENGDGHAAVFIRVENDKMFIYDPTITTEEWYGTIKGWKSSGDAPEQDCIAEYSNRWGSPVERIIAVYNDEIYQTFDTLQEFYDWF